MVPLDLQVILELLVTQATLEIPVILDIQVILELLVTLGILDLQEK